MAKKWIVAGLWGLAAVVALGAWSGSVSPLVAQQPAAVTGAGEPTPDDAVQQALSARLDSLSAALGRVSRQQDSTQALLRTALDDASAEPDSATTLVEDLEATARNARGFGLRTLAALAVLFFAFLLIRASSWLLDLLAERNATRRLLFKRLVPIIRVVVWALSVVVVLRGIYGLETSTLLAAGAGLGVAIGFAAQDLLKNVFGGLVIIGDRPFQVGDKIAIGGAYGEVSSIGLRSTKIVTPDDSLVTVPNSLVLSGQVSNANAGALDCQVVTDLYIPGWVDTRRAKDIAYRAAATSRYVYLKKPVVVIVKDEVHHTFLTHLRVKAYVQDIRHEFLFMSDVTDRARAAFVEAGLLPDWHGAMPLTEMPSGSAASSSGQTRELATQSSAPSPHGETRAP